MKTLDTCCGMFASYSLLGVSLFAGMSLSSVRPKGVSFH